MLQREITVGRDRSCDIVLDNGCQYASRMHAMIYMDGNVLMYRDQSSNGTLVNNVLVRGRAVPIRHGDTIMVAGRYPVSWNVIDRLVNLSGAQSVSNNVNDYPKASAHRSQPNDLERWNWGAFTLYPIWGFWNGCWWGFLVALFFSWIPLVPNIVFGIYGTRWSWENKPWSSVGSFEKAQRDWAIWGIVVFALNIVWWLIFFLLLAPQYYFWSHWYYWL